MTVLIDKSIVKVNQNELLLSSYFADDWWEDKYPFCP
jgi:hypothetical protein